MLTQKELEFLKKNQIPEKLNLALIEFVLKTISVFDDCDQDFEELVGDEFFEKYPETLSDDFSEEEYFKLREEFGGQKASDLIAWCLKDTKETFMNPDIDYWKKIKHIIEENLKES